MSTSRKRAPLTAVGLALVVAGLVANTWFLGLVLSPDHRIVFVPYRVAIGSFEALLLVAGATVLLLRNDHARLRGMAVRAAVLGTTVLLFGLGLEVFLRLHHVGTPYTVKLFAERSAGRLRVRPHLDLSVRIGRMVVPLATNSLGMRWREVTTANPSNRQRIAFVGDSQTFGEWADRIEHSFVGVFDSLLDDRLYEVLNFGAPAYALPEEQRQIAEDVLPFQPRYVMLMLFVGNDFSDTFLGLDRNHVVDGVAVLDTFNFKRRVPAAFRRELEHPTDMTSRIRRALGSVRVFRAAELVYWRYSEAKRRTLFVPSESFMQYTFWSRTDPPPIAVAAVDSTLRVLDEIATACHAHGAILVVATIPCMEQVYARDPEGVGYSVDLPQRYVLEFARRRGIPCLDVLPALRRQALQAGEQLYVQGDMHLSTAGHRVTGEALASFFRSLAGASP